ncbi:MAG: hypothetical protein WA005_17615 [Candidatus Binataceae bacterium]
MSGEREMGGATDAAIRVPFGQPSLATSRRFLIAGVISCLAGFPVFWRYGEHATRLDLVAAILAVGALLVSSRLAQSVSGDRASASRNELISEAAVFIAFLAFYAFTAGTDTSPYNAHVRQAFALIHGHAYIDAPNYIEHAQVGKYSYQLHPPIPAFLLMPIVAIWGMDTNQNYFSIFCGALDIALAWRLLGRFRLTTNSRVWLTVFFGAGTIVWSETVNGSSWAVSMVVAILFTLIALDETYAKARPLVVGIFAGLAGLARYDLPFVWPVYLALLYLRGRRKLSELIWFIPGCALAGVIYVSFNMVRFHSVFDRGVFYYMPPGQQRLFGFSFFPGNLFTLLFMAPNVNGTFPYIHPQFGGQALILTSPAFLLALRPSFRKLENILIAMGALIAMTPSLFYVGNGASQFGTRHYLHAFPFLLLLMAFGVHRRADQLTRILISVSVFLIAFGVWHVRMYGFG